MEVSQRALWLRDWCSDLAKFEIDHIRRAFRDWRLSGQTKFPTPGQIMPVLRSISNPAPKWEKEVAWSELSDAEYEKLDLPAKERHHLILANRAEVKAGPMWRDGRPMRPEDMPASWRELREKAARHKDEARRLRELYRRAERQA